MTEQQAISKIQYRIDTASEITGKGTDGNAYEDLEIAIQALSEIQQYRAIGAVEELKSLKENGAFSGIELAQIASMQMKLKEYQSIGTIEEFKALKEKNVAKKPHSISIANDIGNSMVECPICHARSDYDVKSIKRGHCWKCGQKLDWSE